MGCRLLVVDDDDDDDADDRNNRRVGDDRWCGDTLPPSLSLDVDDGGVGGNVKPATRKYVHAVSARFTVSDVFANLCICA